MKILQTKMSLLLLMLKLLLKLLLMPLLKLDLLPMPLLLLTGRLLLLAMLLMLNKNGRSSTCWRLRNWRPPMKPEEIAEVRRQVEVCTGKWEEMP